MNISELSNTVTRNVVVQFKRISKDVVFFYARLEINSEYVSHSEGINTLSHVRKCVSEATLPTHNSCYVVADKELLELLRCYGFPLCLNEKDFVNSDTGLSPLKRMTELMKKTFSFDSFTESNAMNVVFFEYNTHKVFNVKNKRYISVGYSLENANIGSYSYKLLGDLSEKLIKSGKVLLRKNSCDSYIHKHYDGACYLSGVVQFTQEEYDDILDKVRINHPNSIAKNGHIDTFIFSKYLIDFLDIGDFKKEKEDIDCDDYC